MPDIAKKIDGKKFMWDKGHYSTEDEARQKMTRYENEGFEATCVEENGEYLVYTRRLVTEIVLEEGGQIS
ncbi:MAG: hypothetical protein JXM79_04945 [Sedimentisphaerales bacterium]|nr:hypothetical protein [Sedimentisphaerales bacterium]